MNKYKNAPEWKKQLARELLKPAPKKIARRPVSTPHVDAIWTGDLADIKKYSKVNEDYKYIIVIVDVFSRFAWARPLRLKNSEETSRVQIVIVSRNLWVFPSPGWR